MSDVVDKAAAWDAACAVPRKAQAEIRCLQDALRDIWDQCNDPEGIHVDGIVEAIQKHAPDFLEVLARGPQVKGQSDV